MKFPALLVLLAGAPALLPAQTAFEPLAVSIRSQKLVLPAETALVQLNPADKTNPRLVYSWTRSFASDGGFTTVWKAGTSESSQTFRADGSLLRSRQYDGGKKALLETESDAGRTTIRTKITVDGQVKSDKKAPLKPSIVLRDELQHLVLQAWQAGVRDGLKFQSLSPDGGMVGDFQILFKAVNDPLAVSDKYAFPDEFRGAFAGRSGFVVADMSLQGVGAFFYPHHFYLIYLPSGKTLEWQGYFGEDPKAPVFQFLRK